jgi:hypothetical protein
MRAASHITLDVPKIHSGEDAAYRIEHYWMPRVRNCDFLDIQPRNRKWADQARENRRQILLCIGWHGIELGSIHVVIAYRTIAEETGIPIGTVYRHIAAETSKRFSSRPRFLRLEEKGRPDAKGASGRAMKVKILTNRVQAEADSETLSETHTETHTETVVKHNTAEVLGSHSYSTISHCEDSTSGSPAAGDDVGGGAEDCYRDGENLPPRATGHSTEDTETVPKHSPSERSERAHVPPDVIERAKAKLARAKETQYLCKRCGKEDWDGRSCHSCGFSYDDDLAG